MKAALSGTALRGLEAMINGALAYDPGTRKALSRLAGKTLAVTVTLPPMTLVAGFAANGDIRLGDTPPDTPNTRLEGSAPALIRLALDSGDRASFAGTGVRVSGDQELLREIRALMQDLDIDWEAALATLIGDVPAHLLGKGLRTAGHWRADARQRLGEAASDYLREEARLLPTAAEFEAWSREVSALTLASDRLAARVARLQSRLITGGSQ